MVTTLRRIESDLAPYHDGRLIPFEVLETFSSLELVYCELLVKDSLCGHTAEESETCGLIRCCMVPFQAMCEKWYMQENRPSRELGTQLSMLLEHRFSVPQIADMFGVSVSTIRRRISDYGLSASTTYTNLVD